MSGHPSVSKMNPQTGERAASGENKGKVLFFGDLPAEGIFSFGDAPPNVELSRRRLENLKKGMMGRLPRPSVPVGIAPPKTPEKGPEPGYTPDSHAVQDNESPKSSAAQSQPASEIIQDSRGDHSHASQKERLIMSMIKKMIRNGDGKVERPTGVNFDKEIMKKSFNAIDKYICSEDLWDFSGFKWLLKHYGALEKKNHDDFGISFLAYTISKYSTKFDLESEEIMEYTIINPLDENDKRPRSGKVREVSRDRATRLVEENYFGIEGQHVNNAIDAVLWHEDFPWGVRNQDDTDDAFHQRVQEFRNFSEFMKILFHPTGGIAVPFPSPLGAVSTPFWKTNNLKPNERGMLSTHTAQFSAEWVIFWHGDLGRNEMLPQSDEPRDTLGFLLKSDEELDSAPDVLLDATNQRANFLGERDGK